MHAAASFHGTKAAILSPARAQNSPLARRHGVQTAPLSTIGGRLQRHGWKHRTGLAVARAATGADISKWVEEFNEKRLDTLEEQALDVLRTAATNFERPVFPCALIAGDVAILHLLHRLGFLTAQHGKPAVEVVFIDTFHLFPETHEFRHRLEELFGFKTRDFHAAGFDSKADYVKQHGSDLYMTDIEKYDAICKVEPFARSLEELQADVMINGRRRDHGFERAFLEAFAEGSPVNCQPLAYWSFADCFAYLERHGVPAHPLHAQGYPSVGDVHSTVTVDKSKWFEYGGERSGRFQGLTNADGSLKTECGIHTQSQVAESLAKEGST